MVLVFDPQPAADAPGEPNAAEKVTAVTTRASSAQGSHDKAPRVLLWVKVERVRQRGAPALLVKLSPSPSTQTDGLSFTVEEHTQRFNMPTGPRLLTRGGYRLVRQTRRLRLAIEVRR
jgi:hypothetical protein